MVKWTKVNNEEEHRQLIEAWGKDNIDSIGGHKRLERSYPYWFSNDGSRQLDDGYIERKYPYNIVSFQEVISNLQIEIILW